MTRNIALLMTLLAVAVLMAGCSGANPAAPPTEEISNDMLDIAIDSDLLTETAVMGELGQLEAILAAEGSTGGPTTRTHSFSLTGNCPEGGHFTVDGSITATADPSDGSIEAELAGTRTREDCAFRRHGGMTLVINGTAEWTRFRRSVNGTPDGLQTSHYFGSWTAIRSDGEERSCTYDYTVTRNPEDHTLTFEGTACGNPMGRSMAWSLSG